MIKLILFLKTNKYFIAVLWAFVLSSLASRCCLVVQRHFASVKCIRNSIVIIEFTSTNLLWTLKIENSSTSLPSKLSGVICQQKISNHFIQHNLYPKIFRISTVGTNSVCDTFFFFFFGISKKFELPVGKKEKQTKYPNIVLLILQRAQTLEVTRNCKGWERGKLRYEVALWFLQKL